VAITLSMTPAGGSTLDPADTIEVQLDHEGDSNFLVLFTRLASPPANLICATSIQGVTPGGSGFSPYVVDDISDGTPNRITVRITNSDGWPAGSIEMNVWATESDGNRNFLSQSYTGAGAGGGGDVITAVGPGAIDAADPVVLAIAGDLPDLTIYALFPGVRAEVLLTIESGSPVTGPGYAFTLPANVEITRDDGWPADFSLVVLCSGNADSLSYAYTVNDPTGFGPFDTIAPEVSNVSPAPGVAITAQTPVGLDVTDNAGALRRVLLGVLFTATGITELVHDGDAFVGPYQNASARDPIAGGFRYSLLRDGGWPSSPTVRVFAFDVAGNEV
jgi:hypothetical protein